MEAFKFTIGDAPEAGFVDLGDEGPVCWVSAIKGMSWSKLKGLRCKWMWRSWGRGMDSHDKIPIVPAIFIKIIVYVRTH